MKVTQADVVKLVDTPGLGSGAARYESSSLSVRTIKAQQKQRLSNKSLFFAPFLPSFLVSLINFVVSVCSFGAGYPFKFPYCIHNQLLAIKPVF